MYKWSSVTLLYIMCPPGYYQSANGAMITHALGHMMYSYTLLVPMNNEPKSAQQVKQGAS